MMHGSDGREAGARGGALTLPSIWIPVLPDGTPLITRASTRRAADPETFWGKGIKEVEYAPIEDVRALLRELAHAVASGDCCDGDDPNEMRALLDRIRAVVGSLVP